ncbi:type II toxin-antitoxin system Phd/YefM family antitoxin [Spirillospora sp. CA-253888]
MEAIPDTMAISDARANLTDVVNAVHLQDRTVLLHRRNKPQALLVPPDLRELIEALGGLDQVRSVLREARGASGT